MKSARSSAGASPRSSSLRTPAIEALLIQLLSFALVWLTATVLSALTGLQLTVAIAALLQGAIAAILARCRRMAVWWIPIQFLFPVALIVLLAVRLPSWIFLLAFIVLLVLYWTTFRTQVPFYPSSRATWEAVATLLPSGEPVRFMDIGSGFGGLVLDMSTKRPEGSFTGIEVAPLPWLVSALRARMGRNRHGAAAFLRGDYRRLDFAAYDVIFAYLSPAAMPALW
ncbi:MAG TPA: class I SAM-dependent methyltransferase, partial [Noviherbaspirillum sp.]|nr:class I SAM-dependent methyltransferase [Noviherbaspirillum sp.]